MRGNGESMDFVDVTGDIEPLYRDWLVAAAKGDGSWFREHLAEEFKYLNAGGGAASKSEIIEINQAIQNSRYELGEFVARRYGDVVVAQGVYFGRGDIPVETGLAQSMIDKYARGGDLRFSMVWVPDGESWRCVVLQTTEMPADAG